MLTTLKIILENIPMIIIVRLVQSYFQDEVRANTDDWKSLGMHGNQSGPLVIEGVFSKDRLIGPFGDGAKVGFKNIKINILI